MLIWILIAAALIASVCGLSVVYFGLRRPRRRKGGGRSGGCYCAVLCFCAFLREKKGNKGALRQRARGGSKGEGLRRGA